MLLPFARTTARRFRSPTSYSGLVACSAVAAFCGTSAAMAEESKKAFSPKEFREFPIQEIESLTHNVRRFRMGLPSPEHEMGMTVASCLVIKGKARDGSGDVVRPYTPTTTNDTKGYFELVIKVYPEGNVSSHMFGLNIGDNIAVKGPFPKLEYKPNEKKKIGMVAGGTGITPMLQVLKEGLLDPEDKTEFTLVFVNQTPDDIMIKSEIDALAASHDNFTVIYKVDKDPKGVWDGPVGYISADDMKSHMPAPSPEGMIYVCGPPGLMKAVSGDKAPDKSQGEIGGLLKTLGYTEEMVYKF
ncbi:unnamed protein product [Discosporangium mesarthrocarpum]